jgi:hypothetical protein
MPIATSIEIRVPRKSQQIASTRASPIPAFDSMMRIAVCVTTVWSSASISETPEPARTGFFSAM